MVSSRTVLIAEDEESIRLFLSLVLERQGFAVLPAANAKAALQLVHAHAGAIDLLITDLFLPGIHGTDLAAKVRTLHPAVKVLLISGSVEVAPRPADAGELYFLAKPFTSKRLVDVVNGICGLGA